MENKHEKIAAAVNSHLAGVVEKAKEVYSDDVVSSAVIAMNFQSLALRASVFDKHLADGIAGTANEVMSVLIYTIADDDGAKAFADDVIMLRDHFTAERQAIVDRLISETGGGE